MKRFILNACLGVVGTVIGLVGIASSVIGLGIALHYQEQYGDEEAVARIAEDAFSGYKRLRIKS